MGRLSVFMLGVVTLSILLAACGSADPEIVTVRVTVLVEKEVVKEVEVEKVREVIVPVTTQPDYGGTLRVVSQSSIANLDPLYVAAFVTVHITSHMYETPFGLTPDEDVAPQLVSEWSVSPDNKSYTFTIRDGVTFHNGDPVTADDVIAVMERWAPAPRSSVYTTSIEDFYEVDDKTFKIDLKEPFSPLIGMMGRAKLWIQPREQIAGVPYNQSMSEWVGSGPYEFEKWDQGNKLTLVRYEAYTSRKEPDLFLAGGKQAYLDKITWLEIPDEETKIAGLETGEWDVIDSAGLDFFKRLKDHPEIDIVVAKPGNQSQITINASVPPTTNKLIRKAIQAAINAEDHMRSLGSPDLWILCKAYFFCGTPLETDIGSEPYNSADPEKAKKFLEEAGYDGEPVVILNPTDYPQLTPLGFVLKPNLEAAGFTVEMPTTDWASIVSRLGTPDWNMFTNFCGSAGCGLPLRNFFVTPYDRYGYPGYPDLLAKYTKALDFAQQFAIVEELQVAMYEDAWNINLGQWFPMHPHRSKVKNLQPYSRPMYHNVWIEN